MEFNPTSYLLREVPKDFWQKSWFIEEWGEWAEPVPQWEDVEFELKPEHAGGEGFNMFNTGGVEVEVGNFLYSLIRIMRPELIVETGTHFGISDLYFLLGLRENKKGKLVTIEFNPPFYKMAQALFEYLELDSRVELFRGKVNKYKHNGESIDILFLDTEPSYRFDELIKFWPYVRPGGLIIIHDLHGNLNYNFKLTQQPAYGVFGDFREKIGALLKEHKMQTFTLPTPRGLTIFQKAHPLYGHVRFLQGQI